MSCETPTDLMPASVPMLVSPITPNAVTASAPIDPTEVSPVLASTHVRISYKQAQSGKRVTFTATVLTESGEKPTGTVTFKAASLPSVDVKLQHGTASTKMKAYLLTSTITATYSGDTRHAGSFEELVPTPSTTMREATPRSDHREPVTPTVAKEAVEQGANSNNVSLDNLDDVMLADRIEELWSADQHDSSTIAIRRNCLKDSRVQLGEYLAAYHQRLAKPGRDGMWASFLCGLHIPKSTATRYIKQWELSLCPEPATQSTAVIGEPSEKEMTDLVRKLTSRAKRVLTTEDSITKFLVNFTAALQSHPETT